MAENDSTVVAAWVGDEDDAVLEKVEAAEVDADSRSAAVRGLLEDAPHPEQKRHLDSVYPIEIELTPYKANVIGNRLWKVSEQQTDDEVPAETQWLARRFHAEAKAAEAGEAVLVQLSEMEARIVGNRLHRAGELYDADGDEQVAGETWKLARLFHADCNTRQ